MGLCKTSGNILSGLCECVKLLMGYLGEETKAGKGKD